MLGGEFVINFYLSQEWAQGNQGNPDLDKANT